MDALSDDGRYGLTLIAFIGSVFSPYYAVRGYRAPLDHCAVNVALYGLDGPGWAMTERGRGALDRTADALVIGPSQLTWRDGGLTADFSEIAAPWPRRLKGRVRVHPDGAAGDVFALDPAGRHAWRPFAPRARVEVDLQSPGLSWRGGGYFDSNLGLEPLQDGFRFWNWSRVHAGPESYIFYDVERRDGAREGLALRLGPEGLCPADAPPAHTLQKTFWGLDRAARADTPPRLVRTLEDAPFYSRSELEGVCCGEPARIVHESIDLDRLRSPVVKALLPFRMPRQIF